MAGNDNGWTDPIIAKAEAERKRIAAEASREVKLVANAAPVAEKVVADAARLASQVATSGYVQVVERDIAKDAKRIEEAALREVARLEAEARTHKALVVVLTITVLASIASLWFIHHRKPAPPQHPAAVVTKPDPALELAAIDHALASCRADESLLRAQLAAEVATNARLRGDIAEEATTLQVRASGVAPVSPAGTITQIPAEAHTLRIPRGAINPDGTIRVVLLDALGRDLVALNATRVCATPGCTWIELADSSVIAWHGHYDTVR